MRELSPCRNQLLDLLADGAKSPSDLSKATGRVMTNVTRDLMILVRAGLVTRERDGQYVYYSLARTGTADA